MTTKPTQPPTTAIPPRKALQEWLVKIHYNAVRNIETSFSNITQSDRARPLRGFKIADDLVLTRKRVFYRIKGSHAVPMSIQDVSANYSLIALQEAYRKATQMWKDSKRGPRKRPA